MTITATVRKTIVALAGFAGVVAAATADGRVTLSEGGTMLAAGLAVLGVFGVRNATVDQLVDEIAGNAEPEPDDGSLDVGGGYGIVVGDPGAQPASRAN